MNVPFLSDLISLLINRNQIPDFTTIDIFIQMFFLPPQIPCLQSIREISSAKRIFPSLFRLHQKPTKWILIFSKSVQMQKRFVEQAFDLSNFRGGDSQITNVSSLMKDCPSGLLCYKIHNRKRQLLPFQYLGARKAAAGSRITDDDFQRDHFNFTN